LLRNLQDKAVTRIIDANINRVKEALRVCEEVTRFAKDNRSLTSGLKDIRHQVDLAVKVLPVSFSARLEARCSRNDVGKNVFGRELSRANIGDVFFANMQRIKESTRVLEEFSKLVSVKAAVKFKRLRYQAYDIEKRAKKFIS
jgi:thiamine-phosphate pyrophosphorylase